MKVLIKKITKLIFFSKKKKKIHSIYDEDIKATYMKKNHKNNSNKNKNIF